MRFSFPANSTDPADAGATVAAAVCSNIDQRRTVPSVLIRHKTGPFAPLFAALATYWRRHRFECYVRSVDDDSAPSVPVPQFREFRADATGILVVRGRVGVVVCPDDVIRLAETRPGFVQVTLPHEIIGHGQPDCAASSVVAALQRRAPSIEEAPCRTKAEFSQTSR